MTSSGISLWTAVIAAASALIGVILGQFLQSRRERRIWDRQASEQRRRDQELWRRDDRLRLLAEKRSTYVGGLAAGDQYMDALRYYLHTCQTGNEADKARAYEQWLRAQTRYLEAYQAIRIISSEHIADATREINQLLLKAKTVALFEENPAGLNDIEPEIKEKAGRLRQVLRDDLRTLYEADTPLANRP